MRKLKIFNLALASVFTLVLSAPNLASAEFLGVNSVVDVSINGGNPNAGSKRAALSGDGRYVVFQSQATDLVTTPTNGQYQIYVRDRVTNTIELASVSMSGVGGNAASQYPRITNDGRYVVFESEASNLVPDDTNNNSDIFRRDLLTETTIRVSTTASGGQVIEGGFSPDISADGNRIVFFSFDHRLVSGISPTNYGGIFIKDVVSGAIQMVSKSPTDNSMPNYTTRYDFEPAARISCDGNTIVFVSAANNIVVGDSSTYEVPSNAPRARVYVVDLQQSPITPMYIDPNTNGQWANASISCDGNHVAFIDSGSNLAPGDDIGSNDVFVYDRISGLINMVSLDNNDNHPQVHVRRAIPAISNDGRFIVFSSPINLTDTNSHGHTSIYVRDTHLHTTEIVSKTLNDEPENDNSEGQDISDDGRVVAFQSLATNLVPNFGRGDITHTYISENVWTPPAPTGLMAATPINTDPALSWTGVPDTSEYKIYRDGQYLDSSIDTAYTDTTATEGMHNYYVTATVNTVESVDSNTFSVVVDRTAPTVIYTMIPVADTNGWSNSDVTVSFTCEDDRSGVASCTAPVTLTTDDANQTIIGTATDNAGNTTTITTDGINIDKTAPIIGSPTWSANTVNLGESTTLSIPATDNLSGVVSGEYYIGSDPGVGNGTTFTLDGSVMNGMFSNLPVGVTTVHYRALDLASNWTGTQNTTVTVRPLAPVNLSAPTPTHTTPALSWSAGSPSDSYIIYRNGVLLDSTTTTSYEDTTAQEGVVAYYVTAVANGVESVPGNGISVVVDRTNPAVIYAQTPAPNENGWYNSDVLVSFTCADELSGVMSCTSPITLSFEGAGQTVTGNAEDNAGNTNSVTTDEINIDKTKPTVTAPTMTGHVLGVFALVTATTITTTVGDNLSGVVTAEYYFDTDPGEGNGTAMMLDGTTASANASIASLGILQQHTVYVRSLDAAGNWSDVQSYTFYRFL